MPTPKRLILPHQGIDELKSLPRNTILALDTETTGLDHWADHIRTIQYLPFNPVTWAADEPVRVVDVWAHPEAERELLMTLADFRLVMHNAVFDLGWFLAVGAFPQQSVYCTQVLTKLALAGNRGTAHAVFRQTTLKNAAKYLIQEDVDKSQQSSPWSREVLTEEQLEYAARDCWVLPRMFKELTSRIVQDGNQLAASIESQALPTVAWMSLMGVPLNAELFALPYKQAMIDRERLMARIQLSLTDQRIAAALRSDKKDPKRGGQRRFDWGYEEGLSKLLASPKQLLAALHEIDYPYDSTADDFLAAWQNPLGEMLRDFREADQIKKAFGPSWGRKFKNDEDEDAHLSPLRYGRVFPQIRQAHAETGRMSYAYPNLQQVPNPDKHPLGKQFRAAFAAKVDRELVIADFSQIELRLAAEISGDKAMRQVYLDGGDIHTEAARWVLGISSPTKAHRQIMKSANFGLLYGAGVETFRVYARSNFRVYLTFEEAAAIREKWLKAFPGIRAWHYRTGRVLDSRNKFQGITTRTLANRARKQVTRYTECLNTPVQGSGADIVKLAMGHIYKNRHTAPVPYTHCCIAAGWFPIMVVHDEIVLDCPLGTGEAMAAWLKAQMIAAGEVLLKRVPCDASAACSSSWLKG